MATKLMQRQTQSLVGARQLPLEGMGVKIQCKMECYLSGSIFKALRQTFKILMTLIIRPNSSSANFFSYGIVDFIRETYKHISLLEN